MIVVLLGHIHLFITQDLVFLKENGVIIDIDVIIKKFIFQVTLDNRTVMEI